MALPNRLTLCLLSCAVALALASPSWAITIGVFPFQVTSPNADEVQPIGLQEGLPILLAERLREAGGAEVLALPWPEPVEAGQALPPVPFGALLAAARGAGANAFLVEMVLQFDLAAVEKKGGGGGILGKIGIDLPRGGKRKSEARVALEGGLFDSLTEQVIIPVRSQKIQGADGYDGPGLGELAGAHLSGDAFANSLPGQATTQALEEIAAQIADAYARVSEEPALGVRADAPEGPSFTQTRLEFRCSRAANQWASLEVINAGDAPRSLIVTTQPPGDLVVGVMGSGSVDAPCQLLPSQSKRVRVVVNAEYAQDTEYTVPLRLYDVTDSPPAPGSDREALAGLEVHDRASLTVAVASGQLKLDVKRVADEPARLAQIYEITNVGDETISDFTIAATGDLALGLAMAPTVDHYPLASAETLRVSFYPLLDVDFTGLDGQVTLRGFGQEQPLPVSFALPEGKRVYLAQGNSTGVYKSKNSYCTNAGGGSTDCGGPAGPGDAKPDACKQRDALKREIDNAKLVQRTYDKLSKDPEVRNWDDLEKKVREELEKEPGVKVRTAGELDSKGKIKVYADAYSDLPEPLRSWCREAAKAHEERHKQDLDRWQKEGTWKFASRDPEKLAESEHRAYDKTIEYLQAKLEQLNRDCPGGSGALPDFLRDQARAVAELRLVAQTAGAYCYRIVSLAPTEASDVDWGDDAGYYLATTFSLPYSRSVYTPHDTLVALNGHKVGELTNMMPEGAYLWRLDPGWLNVGGRNIISLSVPRVNQAHYFIANDFEIIAPITDRDRYVVASSQEEANKLYAALTDVNHNRPDLLLAADPTRDISADPQAGEIVSFKATVWNVGAGASKPSRLRILNYDPREPKGDAPRLEDGPSAAVNHYVDRLNNIANPGKLLQRSKLRDVGKPVPIPALEPDTSAELNIEVTYRPGLTTRLFLVADTKDDFDPSTNVATVTFISPEGASPLAGTDYPVLTDVPLLSQVISLPQVPEVEAFTAVSLRGLLDQVPYLRDIRNLEGVLDIGDLSPF